MQADQAVQVGMDDLGVTLELSSSAFYEPGSATLREVALPVLGRIAQIVRADQYRFFNVDVEGHTDDDPISTATFPSNWELSAARAAGVVRFFGEQGIELQRLKASGFAETRPKVPNRDKNGAPIPDNQEVNRRVVIHLSKMSREEKGWFLKQVEPDRFVTEDMQGAPGQEGGQAPPPIQFGPGQADKPEQPAFTSRSGRLTAGRVTIRNPTYLTGLTDSGFALRTPRNDAEKGVTDDLTQRQAARRSGLSRR